MNSVPQPYFPGQDKEHCGCYFPDSLLTKYQVVTSLTERRTWYEGIYNCINCGVAVKEVSLDSLPQVTKEDLIKTGLVVIIADNEIEEFRRRSKEKIKKRLERRFEHLK